jgi:hypothetical protein
VKKDNIDKPTKEQIAAWKAQYGEVYEIEVAEEAHSFLDPGEDSLDEMPKLIGYLKKPDRVMMNFAVSRLVAGDATVGKSILKDCWLGGDARLLTDSGYSFHAGLEVLPLIETYKSRLKKV